LLLDFFPPPLHYFDDGKVVVPPQNDSAFVKTGMGWQPLLPIMLRLLTEPCLCIFLKLDTDFRFIEDAVALAVAKEYGRTVGKLLPRQRGEVGIALGVGVHPDADGIFQQKTVRQNFRKARSSRGVQRRTGQEPHLPADGPRERVIGKADKVAAWPLRRRGKRVVSAGDACVDSDSFH